MLFDLTSRFMPNPKVLQDAIDAGMVGVTTDVNGEVYTVSRHCTNPDAVRAAIDQRRKLIIFAAKVQGVLIAFLLISIVVYAVGLPHKQG
jgi:hypothetical protein